MASVGLNDELSSSSTSSPRPSAKAEQIQMSSPESAWFGVGQHNVNPETPDQHGQQYRPPSFMRSQPSPQPIEAASAPNRVILQRLSQRIVSLDDENDESLQHEQQGHDHEEDLICTNVQQMGHASTPYRVPRDHRAVRRSGNFKSGAQDSKDATVSSVFKKVAHSHRPRSSGFKREWSSVEGGGGSRKTVSGQFVHQQSDDGSVVLEESIENDDGDSLSQRKHDGQGLETDQAASSRVSWGTPAQQRARRPSYQSPYESQRSATALGIRTQSGVGALSNNSGVVDDDIEDDDGEDGPFALSSAAGGRGRERSATRSVMSQEDIETGFDDDFDFNSHGNRHGQQVGASAAAAMAPGSPLSVLSVPQGYVHGSAQFDPFARFHDALAASAAVSSRTPNLTNTPVGSGGLLPDSPMSAKLASQSQGVATPPTSRPRYLPSTGGGDKSSIAAFNDDNAPILPAILSFPRDQSPINTCTRPSTADLKTGACLAPQSSSHSAATWITESGRQVRSESLSAQDRRDGGPCIDGMVASLMEAPGTGNALVFSASAHWTSPMRCVAATPTVCCRFDTHSQVVVSQSPRSLLLWATETRCLFRLDGFVDWCPSAAHQASVCLGSVMRFKRVQFTGLRMAPVSSMEGWMTNTMLLFPSATSTAKDKETGQFPRGVVAQGELSEPGSDVGHRSRPLLVACLKWRRDSSFVLDSQHIDGEGGSGKTTGTSSSHCSKAATPAVRRAFSDPDCMFDWSELNLNSSRCSPHQNVSSSPITFRRCSVSAYVVQLGSSFFLCEHSKGGNGDAPQMCDPQDKTGAHPGRTRLETEARNGAIVPGSYGSCRCQLTLAARRGDRVRLRCVALRLETGDQLFSPPFYGDEWTEVEFPGEPHDCICDLEPTVVRDVAVQSCLFTVFGRKASVACPPCDLLGFWRASHHADNTGDCPESGCRELHQCARCGAVADRMPLPSSVARVMNCPVCRCVTEAQNANLSDFFEVIVDPANVIDGRGRGAPGGPADRVVRVLTQDKLSVDSDFVQFNKCLPLRMVGLSKNQWFQSF